MAAHNVSDSLSNGPEHIKEAAKAIGKSERKRKVFDAIYYHKQVKKSVDEVMSRSGLSRMQVLQAAGQLANAGIVTKDKKDGKMAYCQIPFFQHNKHKILSLVDHPEKLETFATKREPAISFVHVKQSTEPVRNQTSHSVRGRGKKLRIAFIATNPDPKSALRTDIEARAVVQALLKTEKRDEVDIRLFPAATANDFVQALNSFKPHVVHFAGHGGSGGLLFDDETIEGAGGVDVDFKMVNKILASTDHETSVIVFNACSTLVGANVFLENVSVVIAMADSIGDASAAVFSAQFYTAIASSQSMLSALNQGKNAIELAGLGDFDLPQYLCRDSIQMGSYVLVR